MESVTEATEIVRELTIAARPETVWEFLVDPDKATRWMGIAVTSTLARAASCRSKVTPTRSRAARSSRWTPHHLVFTWGWEPTPDGETYDVARLVDDRDPARARGSGTQHRGDAP